MIKLKNLEHLERLLQGASQEEWLEIHRCFKIEAERRSQELSHTKGYLSEDELMYIQDMFRHSK